MKIEKMHIEIISFGKISELMDNQTIEIEGVGNTDELQQYLEKKYPALKEMKYKLALDKNIVQQNAQLKNHDCIAIMPPFSGG